MRVRHLWLRLFAVALVLYAMYWLLTRPWPVSPLTVEEKQMTDTLFEQTKPQCLGRYLFDVPVSFTNTLADQVKLMTSVLPVSDYIVRHLNSVFACVSRS